MSRRRNPMYDKRDLLFVRFCEKCRRAERCTFTSSDEGPEAVCFELVEIGTYNCESCVRRNLHGGCRFKCVFFRPK